MKIFQFSGSFSEMELLNVAFTIDEQYLMSPAEINTDFILCAESTVRESGSVIPVGNVSIHSMKGTCSNVFEAALISKAISPKRPQVSQALSPAKRTKSEKPLFAKATQIVSPRVSCVADNVSRNSNANEGFGECVLAGEKFFMCASCSYKSKDKANMCRHVQCKHSENPPRFTCRTCTSAYTERNKLKNHYVKAHNLDPISAKAASDSC